MEKETLIKNHPDNENKIKLKGVTKKQIKLFKDKKLPLLVALGLFGGAGINYAFMSASGKIVDTEEDADETSDEISDETRDNSSSDTEEELFDYEVPTTIEFCDIVSDDMSFGEAFRAAREDAEGGAGFFNWRGSTYHTLTKEEWEALSPEEQQEFFDKIQEHSDFDQEEYNKVDDQTDENEEVVDDTKDQEESEEQTEEEAREEEAEKEESEEKADEEETREEETEKEESDKQADEEEARKEEDEKEESEKQADDEQSKEEKNVVDVDTPDEVTYDDIDYSDFEGTDSNTQDQAYVNIEDLNIPEDALIDGLNDGKAKKEKGGIEGGDEYDPEDYKNEPDDLEDSDTDVDYDNDDLEDYV